MKNKKIPQWPTMSGVDDHDQVRIWGFFFFYCVTYTCNINFIFLFHYIIFFIITRVKFILFLPFSVNRDYSGLLFELFSISGWEFSTHFMRFYNFIFVIKYFLLLPIVWITWIDPSAPLYVCCFARLWLWEVYPKLCTVFYGLSIIGNFLLYALVFFCSYIYPKRVL